MGQNLVARHLTEQEWAQFDEALAQAAAVLAPLLVPLTATDKKFMVKMGEGSEAFCRQSHGVAKENLELMPRSFDLDEMQRDLATHDALNLRIVKLTRLLDQARDAEMALGSDVMVASLEAYAVLKAVGKGDGVQSLTKMLGRHFGRSPREEKPAPATT